MPSANPPTKPPVKGSPKKPDAKAGLKGKGPLGIPVWGWIIAAVIGIIIGYTVLRKSSGAASGGNPADSSASPSGESAGKGGGGTIALPPQETPVGGGNNPPQTQTGATIEGLTDPGNTSGGATPSPLAQALIDSGFTPGNFQNIPGVNQGLTPAQLQQIHDTIPLTPTGAAPISPQTSHSEFVAKSVANGAAGTWTSGL